MAHAIWITYRHHRIGVVCGIDANNVEQIRWAHWPAVPFHHFVDLPEVCAIFHQGRKATEIREQNSVNQEAWAVIHNNWGFTHRFCISDGTRNGCFRRFLTADNLNQRHLMHGVKEVHTAEVFRFFQSRSQLCNRDR